VTDPVEKKLRALVKLWQTRAKGLEDCNSSQPVRAEERSKALRECAEDLLDTLDELKAGK
jgi:hypothetical protein